MKYPMTKTEMKKELVGATYGCNVQHTGWPCGTCFFAMSKRLTNQDWQAILLFRGDYKKEDLKNLPNDINKSLEKVLKIAKNINKKKQQR